MLKKTKKLLIEPYGIETTDWHMTDLARRNPFNRTLWNWNMATSWALAPIAGLLIEPYGIETMS